VAASHMPKTVLRHEPTRPINGLCLGSYLRGDAPSCWTLKGDMITGAVTGAARRAKTGHGDSQTEKQLFGAGESHA
jgi:hypothetical protein